MSSKVKDREESWTPRSCSRASDALAKLFVHAVKVIGSKERVRAMLRAGTLKIKLPTAQKERGSRWTRCGAYARSTSKPLPGAR